MSVFGKELRNLLRSPVLWLMMALLSFVSAWMCWQMLDRYLSLQSQLSQLPYPPAISQTLWQPMLLMLVKIMMLLVALVSASVMTRERSEQTTFYLILSKRSPQSVMMGKFLATWVLLLYLWLHIILIWALLETGGSLNGWQVFTGVTGISLTLIWMLALGMLIAVHNSSMAASALMTVLVLAGLWMLGAGSYSSEFGLSWLSLWSPAHHFKWLLSAELSVSSLVYFVGGAWLFLFLTNRKLLRLREAR